MYQELALKYLKIKRSPCFKNKLRKTFYSGTYIHKYIRCCLSIKISKTKQRHLVVKTPARNVLAMKTIIKCNKVICKQNVFLDDENIFIANVD